MKNPAEFSPQRVTPVEPFAPGISIDYQSLLGRMLRNWYWFVLTLGVCLGLAYLHLRYSTPLYRAETSMLIKEESSGPGGLSKEMISRELGFEDSYVISNEIYVLRSNYLMERVVEALGLDISYIHQGTVRNTEIYNPESFRLVAVDSLSPASRTAPAEYGSIFARFDNTNTFSLIRAEGDTVVQRYAEPFLIGNQSYELALVPEGRRPLPDDIYQIKVTSVSDAARKYSGATNISQVERSAVVNMTIVDPIPAKARDILNTLVTAYERQIVEQQSQTGGQTLTFIEERLDSVTLQLNTVESDLTGFKRSAGMTVDLQTQGAEYLARMKDVDQQLAELRVRRELIEGMRETLTQPGEDYQPLPVASEIISGVLSSQIVEYNAAIFQRDNFLEGVTAEHPAVATYTERLENIKRGILLSINTVLRENADRVKAVEERAKPLENQMAEMPANQQRLLQIMRQQEIKNNLFMFLLEKREEAALTVAAQVPNTRIIDRAISSRFPIAPNKPIIYLLAIGVGLFIPAGTLFLRELLGKSITTEREINPYLPYPVVGRIVKADDHGKLVVNKTNRSGLAEAFRLLRTNLGFLLSSDKPSVILVSSSVSGEGKSFIASNLGAALALSKKRVVVVGMDMRKPKLAEMVLQDKKAETAPAGLSNYLVDRAEYRDILIPTEQERLTIIPSGPIPPNPAELIMDERMGQLLQQLREDFDVIILDAPPVGIVSDGLLMKDEVDLTLFVVRLGVTPKKGMPRITEMVESGRLPRPNLVINGLQKREAYGYGYGYYE